MRTPQVQAMPAMTPLGFKEPSREQNEKTIAERKWRAGLKPNEPQKPCEFGLFGDSHKQKEMF